MQASIVICTLDRPDSLLRCLRSIDDQTCKDFEIKLVKEKGELAKLRNQGAQGAKGEILIFIDDDTICSPGWLQNILDTFQKWDGIGGVSGPAIIPERYKKQRDIFRYRFIKRGYDLLFLGKQASLPGHITTAGAWTTGASEETCVYEGEVQFLEACNMAWRKEAFNQVGGFDENYRGIGDWSEPDLAFRVREKGWKLHFSPGARLTHLPDQTGAYLSRSKTGARLTNYFRFSKRWIKPCLKHSLYKGFLRIYYGLKEIRGILNR